MSPRMRTVTLLTTGFLVVGIAGKPAIAQGTPIQIDISQALGQALGSALNNMPEAMAKAEKNAVRVTPEVIAVDPKTNAATVRFVNPGDDSVRTNISVQYGPLRQTTNTKKSVAGGLVVDDSAANDSAKTSADAAAAATPDTADKRWSLESWIKDMPSQLTLKPHETRTVTIHLTVPASLKAGDYSAYIVATTNPIFTSKAGQDEPTANGGGGGIQFSGMQFTLEGSSSPKRAAKLVYHAAGQ